MRLLVPVTIVASVVAFAAGATGYVVGIRHGIDHGARIELTIRGRLSLAAMNALRAGKLPAVRSQLERDVDVALLSWRDLRSSRMYPYLDHLAPMPIQSKLNSYVEPVALYRAASPSTFEFSPFIEDPEFADSRREIRSIVDEIVGPDTGSNNKLQRTRGGSFGEQ